MVQIRLNKVYYLVFSFKIVQIRLNKVYYLVQRYTSFNKVPSLNKVYLIFGFKMFQIRLNEVVYLVQQGILSLLIEVVNLVERDILPRFSSKMLHIRLNVVFNNYYLIF